jgi:2,4-dienoyl-CoA reductase-like NADH-dependent reductase (Old Yellow Enzyme family)
MSKLFESTSIKGMTLKNRFVRSATYEGMADTKDGSCTPRLIDLMADLAKGEVGLIMTGHAYVNRQGQARPGQTGVYADALLPGLTRMAEAVHAAGGATAVQLAHAGCHSFAVPPGEQAVGPSAMEVPNGASCRGLTKEEIAKTVEDFGKAAVRAKKAGYDGVQIHSAHGYFLSEFLSPFYNKRTDEYGGALENRARIVLEVFRAVRSAVGDDFPVMIKMNSDDYLENGFTRTEMVQVSAMLEREGIDAIEMSGGTHLTPQELSFSRVTGAVPEEKELYFLEAAKLYKEKVDVPLMLVGGIRSLSVAEKVVSDGLTEYVSLCRPLIREPDLIRRWRSGDTAKATCLSCNQCFEPARSAEGMYCVAEERQRRRNEDN